MDIKAVGTRVNMEKTKWTCIIRKCTVGKWNRGHWLGIPAASFAICVDLDILNFTEVQFPY